MSAAWGFAPDPNGGAYSAPPDPIAGLRGPTSKGRGKGRGRGGEGSYFYKGRGGKEREKRGGDGRGKEEKGGGRGRGKGGRGLRRDPLRILAGGPECEVTPLSRRV